MEVRPIDANALERDYREDFERVYKHTRDAVNPADFYIERMAAYNKELVRMEMEAFCKYLQARPTLSLNTLRDEIYQDAVAHGLWMDTDGPMRCASQIDGEVQELFEEAGNVLDVRVDGGDETEVWAAYCEELADVIITGFSVAGKLGIDIDAAIRRKMEINKKRPWRHGK